jgi:putative RNA 2'-phosphotransferase
MNLNNISRSLTKALRHTPKMFHLILDSNGWASVSQVLHNVGITMEELIEIVETNDKQRLAFNADRTMIRANQGHSIPIDLGLKPVTPPHTLYHGTAIQNVAPIRKEGLIKGTRHHVHMSDDSTSAVSVGRRSGTAVLLVIDAPKMIKDGYKIYQSENGVYLTDHVPSKYISEYIFK